MVVDRPKPMQTVPQKIVTKNRNEQNRTEFIKNEQRADLMAAINIRSPNFGLIADPPNGSLSIEN